MGGAVVGLCALDDIGDVVLVGAELDINLRGGPRRCAAPEDLRFFGSAAGVSGAAAAAGTADFFSDIAYTFFPVFHCKLETWMISGPEAVLPVSPTAFCSCQRLEALYLYNSYFFDVCKVFFGKSIPIFLRPEHSILTKRGKNALEKRNCPDLCAAQRREKKCSARGKAEISGEFTRHSSPRPASRRGREVPRPSLRRGQKGPDQ